MKNLYVIIACPVCGGDSRPTSSVNGCDWMRCRVCGWDFNEDEAEPQPARSQATINGPRVYETGCTW